MNFILPDDDTAANDLLFADFKVQIKSFSFDKSLKILSRKYKVTLEYVTDLCKEFKWLDKLAMSDNEDDLALYQMYLTNAYDSGLIPYTDDEIKSSIRRLVGNITKLSTGVAEVFSRLMQMHQTEIMAILVIGDNDFYRLGVADRTKLDYHVKEYTYLLNTVKSFLSPQQAVAFAEKMGIIGSDSSNQSITLKELQDELASLMQKEGTPALNSAGDPLLSNIMDVLDVPDVRDTSRVADKPILDDSDLIL